LFFAVMRTTVHLGSSSLLNFTSTGKSAAPLDWAGAAAMALIGAERRREARGMLPPFSAHRHYLALQH